MYTLVWACFEMKLGLDNGTMKSTEKGPSNFDSFVVRYNFVAVQDNTEKEAGSAAYLVAYVNCSCRSSRKSWR